MNINVELVKKINITFVEQNGHFYKCEFINEDGKAAVTTNDLDEANEYLYGLYSGFNTDRVVIPAKLTGEKLGYMEIMAEEFAKFGIEVETWPMDVS